jgi:hypothetical protein
LHERVDVPDPPETVVWVRVHWRFVEFVVTDRLTVPAKPFSGLTLIVELPTTPALSFRLVGLAVTVKSGLGLKR